MTRTVKHYEQIARATRGNNFDKIRAVFKDYARPVGKFNPALCVYKSRRTFSQDIEEILGRTAGQDSGRFFHALNTHFQADTQKDRIKDQKDFHLALRAVSRVIRDSTIVTYGPGNLISLKGLTPAPSAHSELGVFDINLLNAGDRSQFLALHRKLISALAMPRVDEKSVSEVISSCALSDVFEYSDLINFKDPKTGEAALHACIQAHTEDDHESAKLAITDLVTRGADINAQDVVGRTAVLKASVLNLTKIATHLHYTHGASIDVPSSAADSHDLPTHYLRFSADEANLIELTTFPPEKDPEHTHGSTGTTVGSFQALNLLVVAARSESTGSGGFHAVA